MASPCVADDAEDAERKQRLYGVDTALQEEIDKAVDRGRAFLLRHQERGLKGKQAEWNGSFRDLYTAKLHAAEHAFILYTLLACGEDPEGEAFLAGTGCERVYGKFSGDHTHLTYGYAVQVLLNVARIEAIQAKYADAPRVPRAGRRVLRSCKEEIKKYVRKFERSQEKHVWRYPGPWTGSPAVEDLSATQYVMLALQGAVRVGVLAPKDAGKMCVQALPYFLRYQERSGKPTRLQYWNEDPDAARYGELVPGREVEARGWSYVGRDVLGESEAKRTATGSMTAAGLVCLSVAKELLTLAKKIDPRGNVKRAKEISEGYTAKQVDDGILSGWAKMGEIFKVDGNPGGHGWHFYWLHGVERVGAFLGVPVMGTHRWYHEGSKYLVGKQVRDDGREQGSWTGNEGAGRMTCFALLFLKRATKPPTTPIIPPVVTR